MAVAASYPDAVTTAPPGTPEGARSEAVEGPRSGPLGTTTDNASTRPSTGPSRFALLDFLRDASSLSRQRACLTDCNPQGVTVGRRGESVTFSSAVVCGFRSCPNCGPRIAGEHRDDIAQVVATAQRSGYVVKFLTLTMRHAARDELADLVDALLKCWRGLTTGREWSETKRASGLVGAVRVVEVKWGARNGWHPHAHVLLFFRPCTERHESSEFRASVEGRWATLTAGAGYPCGDAGVDLRDVRPADLDTMAGYMTKGWDVAVEMTAGALKGSEGHWTPRDLLVMAAEGDRDAERLFREYEQGTYGRRLYASASASLRSLLAQSPVEFDEGAAAEEPAPREPLVRISRQGFQSFTRVKGARDELAAVVLDAAGPWDVAWWLSDRGIRSTPCEAVDVGPRPTLAAVESPPGSPAWLALV